MVQASAKLIHTKADDLITEIEAFAITLYEVRLMNKMMSKMMTDRMQKNNEH